jgi:acetate kinase
MRILTVNAGSSSLRLAVFSGSGVKPALITNEHYAIKPAQQAQQVQVFFDRHGYEFDLVAHRLVHGGNHITKPTLVNDWVETAVEQLTPLAPLHNPSTLSLIRICRSALGETVMQVVVPDTGFYTDLPDVASQYALPRELSQRLSIRRFGFHGLAHQAMLQRWYDLQRQSLNRGRVISLQLGAGCSITATLDGRSVDTSMGFTPLEGLVMATRCGDLDPGLVLYLQREAGYTGDDLDRILNQESGLLGLSAESADMRELLKSDEPAAKLAVELYCYRATKYIGAYLAVLGGADAVLFGGGVGEHSPPIREKILANMAWLGMVLDKESNRTAIGREARISTPQSKTEVWVIRADEGTAIARDALRAVAETAL